jgi:hypothetical protein
MTPSRVPCQLAIAGAVLLFKVGVASADVLTFDTIAAPGFFTSDDLVIDGFTLPGATNPTTTAGVFAASSQPLIWGTTTSESAKSGARPPSISLAPISTRITVTGRRW